MKIETIELNEFENFIKNYKDCDEITKQTMLILITKFQMNKLQENKD